MRNVLGFSCNKMLNHMLLHGFDILKSKSIQIVTACSFIVRKIVVSCSVIYAQNCSIWYSWHHLWIRSIRILKPKCDQHTLIDFRWWMRILSDVSISLPIINLAFSPDLLFSLSLSSVLLFLITWSVHQLLCLNYLHFRVCKRTLQNLLAGNHSQNPQIDHFVSRSLL